MQAILPVTSEKASGLTLRLLQSVNAERGHVPNMIQTMGQSDSTLEAYLRFSRSLTAGSLSPRLRKQIALTIAQATICEYSIAQHSALAARLGMSDEEVRASRMAQTGDPRIDTVLRFARDLINGNGQCSTAKLRRAGFDDAAIIEIVAQVALCQFEILFHSVVQTELDFPRVGLRAAAA